MKYYSILIMFILISCSKQKNIEPMLHNISEEKEGYILIYENNKPHQAIWFRFDDLDGFTFNENLFYKFDHNFVLIKSLDSIINIYENDDGNYIVSFLAVDVNYDKNNRYTIKVIFNGLPINFIKGIDKEMLKVVTFGQKNVKIIRHKK